MADREDEERQGAPDERVLRRIRSAFGSCPAKSPEVPTSARRDVDIAARAGAAGQPGENNSAAKDLADDGQA
jgi:hypothetical protein